MIKSEKRENNKKSENEVEKKANPAREESVDEKLKANQDKLLRTLAEMENQRRRFEKEKQEAFEFGGFNFAKESLSILDNIDRAVIAFKNDAELKNNKDLNKILDAMEIIKKDLISIFAKNQIIPIDCINKKFDPNFHQAMLEIEDNNKEVGVVTQEIQKGYMMKDRLLRPSLVGVTKKTGKHTEKEDKNEK